MMDPSLWQQFAVGDRQAFAEVYRYFFGRLYNYGRKFTDLEQVIEDAIQEAFVAIWKSHGRFAAIEAPDSYLFYTFRNCLFYKLKKESKAKRKENQLAWEPEFNVEYLMIKGEMDAALRRELRTALKALPARQREAIYLRFYEGLEYDQIAAIMDISLKATYKTVSKGLVHLRDQLHLPITVLVLLLAGE